MSHDFPQVEAFRIRLHKLGKNYICNALLPDTAVSVSFLGPFQGQTVLWNMTLATLHYFRANISGNIAIAQTGIVNHPFIEINGGHAGIFQLQVGLDLELIDEPVIKKAIIMIRNYKRLVPGRIEFGSMHS